MTVNVYHKHSVVKGKAPDARQIELGEIAINANQDSPAIYIKDSADNIVEISAGCDCDAINDAIKELEHTVELLEDKLNSIPDPEKVEDLYELLKSFKAQIDLNAECCADSHQQIDGILENLKEIQAELGKIEVNINEIAKDIIDLKEQVIKNKVNIEQNEGRIDVLETVDVHHKTEDCDEEVLVTQEDTYKWEISMNPGFVERVDILETADVVPGNGIIVEQTDTYKWKVRVDVNWLDAKIDRMITEALKPYAKQDIEVNTPPRSDGPKR